MPITVVLAEDNALLRTSLARLIEHADDLALAGTAADLPELERLITDTDPDVVVTDIRMPPPVPTRACESRRACVTNARRSVWWC